MKRQNTNIEDLVKGSHDNINSKIWTAKKKQFHITLTRMKVYSILRHC